MAGEPQSAAVLGDRAHGVLQSPVQNLRIYLQGHPDLRPD